MSAGAACPGRRALLVVAATLTLSCLGTTRALAAETPSAWWNITSTAEPSHIAPGGTGTITVTAVNVGYGQVDAASSEVTLSDALPAGLTATAISGLAGTREPGGGSDGPLTCSTPEEISAGQLHCSFKDRTVGGQAISLIPYDVLEVQIAVKAQAQAPAGEESNRASVSGGQLLTCLEVTAGTGLFANNGCQGKAEAGGDFEAQVGGEVPGASVTQPVDISSEPVPFGVESYSLDAEEAGGEADTQAGSHPFQLTSTLALNRLVEPLSANGMGKIIAEVPAPVRDLKVNLPPGLVGNPTVFNNKKGEEEDCTESQFSFIVGSAENLCPASTAVGVATVTIDEPETYGITTKLAPIFKLKPHPGEPARFGFEIATVPVILNTALRTGSDYAAVVTSEDTSEAASLLRSVVTFWGDPGDPRHDSVRGWGCFLPTGEEREGCKPPKEPATEAFLTLPTKCPSQLASTVEANSWLREQFNPPVGSSSPTGVECHQPLALKPEIAVTPEEHTASTPTGLEVKIKVPQEGILAPSGLAEADIKANTVALPTGLLSSPGVATGLSACPAAGGDSIGFEGQGLGEGAQLENDHFSPEAASCLNSSKIGTVHIKTPLLANELKGSVYLAQQDTNPFQSPLVLYLVAEDPVSGTRVKLAGQVSLNSGNGQLVSTFENTPPLPFSELTLNLFGGERAAQSTPALCGSYTTNASFTPWSGGAAAQASSSFQITSGAGGSSCQSPQAFAPSFQAGTTESQAGAFTPFTLTINRPDGQQALERITLHMPPGLAAMISSVTPCTEQQAEKDECGAESLIGHLTAVSGLGNEPVTLGGEVFLTGPYEGAPFGLLTVTNAEHVGPFDLGKIVVRSKIEVDPNTAAVTVTSDQIPQFVKGAASQLKQLTVTVERPNFQFNPTSCNPMAITGTLNGYEGAGDAVSSPFQAGNCAALGFHPDFTASTSAHTSKADGASLDVKITYPKGAYANVAKSVTDLPYALPSRLTTIQKACPDTTFDANPANCDEGSVIGEGIVHTPVFKNPLVGPAYLVSHGNRAFPDLEIVLQGEGVTIVLDGETDIKKGITKTTFNAVPDAPVEVFELLLPEGPHSALAANSNLCHPSKPEAVKKKITKKVHGRKVHVTETVTENVPEKLVIPTKLTAQNGLVLEQQTPIKVSGCKAVKSYKAKKKPKKGKRGKKKKKKK